MNCPFLPSLKKQSPWWLMPLQCGCQFHLSQHRLSNKWVARNFYQSFPNNLLLKLKVKIEGQEMYTELRSCNFYFCNYWHACLLFRLFQNQSMQLHKWLLPANHSNGSSCLPPHCHRSSQTSLTCHQALCWHPLRGQGMWDMQCFQLSMLRRYETKMKSLNFQKDNWV